MCIQAHNKCLLATNFFDNTKYETYLGYSCILDILDSPYSIDEFKETLKNKPNSELSPETIANTIIHWYYYIEYGDMVVYKLVLYLSRRNDLHL